MSGDAAAPRRRHAAINTFHVIRKLGNATTHEFTSNHREAIQVPKLAWSLSIWHHCTFGNPPGDWKLGAFIKPTDPSAQVQTLEERIASLEKTRQASQR